MSDNPAAFPCTGEGFGSELYTQKGMTLRDYFAGQALAGIMARLDPSGFNIGVDLEDWSCPVGDAYRVADEMLIQRTKGDAA
jgi:hypothetical protein